MIWGIPAQQFDPSKYKEGQRQDWDSVAEAWKKWWPYFERKMQQVSTKRGPEEQEAYWEAFVAAVKGHASHDGSVKLTGDTIIVAGTK